MNLFVPKSLHIQMNESAECLKKDKIEILMFAEAERVYLFSFMY